MLKTRQISVLLSSIWVQAISHLNTPANYEAIANTYSLVVIFSQHKVIVHVVNVSPLMVDVISFRLIFHMLYIWMISLSE